MVDFGGAFTVPLGVKWVTKLAKKLGQIRGKQFDQIQEIALQVNSVDPKALAKLYVEPDVQYLNPADFKSRHSRENPFRFRTEINDFIDSEVVEKNGSHVLFILGDAGMGKTSALVMLRMTQIVGFWPDSLNFEIFKLGPTTLTDIAGVKDPMKTVLLLDSLDEDPAAFRGAEERLLEILEASRVFHRVVITCRTQFFPQKVEPDSDQKRMESSGEIRVGGYICNLVYLSRFRKEQVALYLRKKFPFWRWFYHLVSLKGDLRRRAYKIVANMNELRMRPLLLSYIDVLLKSKVKGTSIVQTYETLVYRWLSREVIKIKEMAGKGVELEVLRGACEDLAFHLQINKRSTISLGEIEKRIPIALQGTIEAMDIGGRSLLNRTSAGEYRFAHRTIQEYLAFQWVLKSEDLVPPEDRILFQSEPIGAFLEDYFSLDPSGRWPPHFHPLASNLSTAVAAMVDLTGADLNGANLNGTNLSRANLKGAKLNGAKLLMAYLIETNLSRTNLSGTNLNGAKLNGADLREAKLYEAHLVDADLKGANLDGAKLFQANLKGANLAGDEDETVARSVGGESEEIQIRITGLDVASLREADLREADLTETNLKGANLFGADLTGADLTGANLIDAKLDGAKLNGAKLFRADLKGAKLYEAHLVDADLTRANLKGAKLFRADLRGAKLYEAHLVDADLTDAKVTKAQLDQVKQR